MALTDEQRFPLLTDQGRRLLRRLREHRFAPRFNHRCGDRLTAQGLEKVHGFEQDVKSQSRTWSHGHRPAWLESFADHSQRMVPFYRERGRPSADFFSIPPIQRADLARAPWVFVPDDASLDDLILYSTTGTTGEPLSILCHPVTSSMFLPSLKMALDEKGVRLTLDADRVAMAVICSQRSTFTYASLSSYLAGAGFLKLNLNPTDWNNPDHRLRFLEEEDPQILSGDPHSLSTLADLSVRLHPKALVSTAMALRPEVAKRLRTHFQCPVLDIYSMNETKFIALGGDNGHMLFHHDTYVEILGPAGEICPPGVRGEVVISGGRNTFLPLLRYRTGDFASLDFSLERPVLVGLEGRDPVVFQAPDGRRVNNIDVSQALVPLAVTRFTLLQRRDGRLLFKHAEKDVPVIAIQSALQTVFGDDTPIDFEPLNEEGERNGKVILYRSELNQ